MLLLSFTILFSFTLFFSLFFYLQFTQVVKKPYGAEQAPSPAVNQQGVILNKEEKEGKEMNKEGNSQLPQANDFPTRHLFTLRDPREIQV